MTLSVFSRFAFPVSAMLMLQGLLVTAQQAPLPSTVIMLTDDHAAKAISSDGGGLIQDTLPAELPCSQTVASKVLNLPYSLNYPNSLRYNGDSRFPLTNGNVEHPECDVSGFPLVWTGFLGVDLDLEIKTRTKTEIRIVEIRFLDLPGSSVLAPDSVEVYVKKRWGKYEKMLEPDITRKERKTEGEIVTFSFEGRKTDIRRVKVVAKSVKVCPPGHPSEGKPAWLFSDEIIVR